MFSVDNFYSYLMHRYSWPRKNNFIHAFKTHGSRNIYELELFHYNTPEFYNQVRSAHLENYYGGIFMFDQEPIEFNQYEFNTAALDLNAVDGTDNSYLQNYSVEERIAQRMVKVHTPIICHSEKNSSEVEFFNNQGFLDVHFWYHGLIARDWFRHWKHYKPLLSTNKRLGCYIRDTSGTREYRKNLLEFIQHNDIFCPLVNGEQHDSNASAVLEWGDTGNFDIHIVAETLFDTQKTHLTEKVLKPVAMEQPFILFAGPNSLQYMRDYGFQTFACCWDESYDEIADPNERYAAILDLMTWLQNLPNDRYNKLISRAELIAKNNKEHMFSQRFEDQLLGELYSGIDTAIQQQTDNFFTDPGGTFFRQAQEFLKYPNGSNPGRLLREAPIVLRHIHSQHPNVSTQIIRKYPNLF